MNRKAGKPTAEAKALSLFLMAFKSSNPAYKEKSKRINRLWSLVLKNELSTAEYAEKVDKTLTSYGGYDEVIEKTVKYYVDKTGEWTLKGEDKYCLDAQLVADRMLKK
jgi:hypothetical protein